MAPRSTQRTSLLASGARNSASAFGALQRYRLRYSLSVLLIQFVPFLASALHRNQLRASWSGAER